MSHPARGPRMGIDGQANAAGCRLELQGLEANAKESSRMSHPARGPRMGMSGDSRQTLRTAWCLGHPSDSDARWTDGQANAAGCRLDRTVVSGIPEEAAP